MNSIVRFHLIATAMLFKAMGHIYLETNSLLRCLKSNKIISKVSLYYIVLQLFSVDLNFIYRKGKFKRNPNSLFNSHYGFPSLLVKGDKKQFYPKQSTLMVVLRLWLCEFVRALNCNQRTLYITLTRDGVLFLLIQKTYAIYKQAEKKENPKILYSKTTFECKIFKTKLDIGYLYHPIIEEQHSQWHMHPCI